MNKIAGWSLKGGTGKTQTTTQLCAIARHFGQKVAFIDLDPQKSALRYFSLLADNVYAPNYSFTDIRAKIPDDVDLVIVDTPPNYSWIPTPDYLIVSPILASLTDIHAYEPVLELSLTQPVIKVINQFNAGRTADNMLLDSFNECVCIPSNAFYRNAMLAKRTIIDFKGSARTKCLNHLSYLMQRCIEGSAEKMDIRTFRAIDLYGLDYKEQLEKKDKKTKNNENVKQEEQYE